MMSGAKAIGDLATYNLEVEMEMESWREPLGRKES